jgi:hypothetical protein
MNKFILSTAALAMSLGMATATAPAFAAAHAAQAPAMADTNKDGMVSKEEFLATMGKMYDDKMGKMKMMPAAEKMKMMKDDQMTIDGYRALLRELSGGQ